MPAEPELPFPRALALAEMWARTMGRNTRRGELVDRDERVPLRFVGHGSFDLFVREHHGCILVFLLVELPPARKSMLGALAPDEQRRALNGL